MNIFNILIAVIYASTSLERPEKSEKDMKLSSLNFVEREIFEVREDPFKISSGFLSCWDR